MNLTYDPYEFAVMMDWNMNEQSIYSNMMSGRNPSPLCLPIPTGALALGLEMCVHFFNIFMPGANMHVCMDMMARVKSQPVMILHFDCMRMGQDGATLLKPEDDGGLMQPNEEAGEDPANFQVQ